MVSVLSWRFPLPLQSSVQALTCCRLTLLLFCSVFVLRTVFDGVRFVSGSFAERAGIRSKNRTCCVSFSIFQNVTRIHFLGLSVIPAKNAHVCVSVFLAFSVLPIAIGYLAVVFGVPLRNACWRARRERGSWSFRWRFHE